MFEVPTPEQQIALDLVAGIYLKYGKWPAWAWLAEQLDDRGQNAVDLLASIRSEPTHNYGPLWPRRQGEPFPSDQIGLTIAGWVHLERDGAKLLVDEFVNLVDALGTCRKTIRLDPFANELPRATREQVLSGRITSSIREPLVFALLGKEPATWLCIFEPNNAEWQSVQLTPEIRRFAGVQSPGDYLNRMTELLTPMVQQEAPTYVSPFTLPAAIDYLDAVWRNQFGDRLVNPPGVERSARLAFDATTPEEADSRFSALAELLTGLNVPGVPGLGGHPLKRLGPFLEGRLPLESHERIHKAVALLDAARQIRAGAQHSGAQSRAIDCFALLGIPYPVYDWPAAWARAQSMAAFAFDSIRDEIQAT